MDRILDYNILEVIREGKSSIIYRAVRSSDNLPVILKTLRQHHPLPRDILKYKQEYRISKALENLSCINVIYDFIKYDKGLITIYEDSGGMFLDNLMKAGSLSFEQSLKIAIGICSGLGEIHARNILYRNLIPCNIMVKMEPWDIRLVNFSLASYFSEDSQSSASFEKLDSSLAYVSPEQTGRINRPVDYRSDYYSLGVILYELFTGRLPFESDDPLELVHSHVARRPGSPVDLKSGIPSSLSEIIMKLISKGAEERYQSSYGIRADLELCLQRLGRLGADKTFKLGLLDIPERFAIPRRLYGRDNELGKLGESFELVASGGKRLTLVAGHAGIGKTSLVDQFYKNITSQKGYFASGKFDQLHRNIPHGSVITPFRGLIKQILTEPQDVLTEWKSKFLGALGVNCRVIMDFIPDIELIVGPQPAVPELEPTEAQSRFRIVFQEFVRVFCRPETPLLIFLDDLQWADLSSLKMLELIMVDPEIRYLYLIASFRDEEVDSSHPLMITLEAIQKTGIIPEILKLESLRLDDICRLLSDTLKRRSETVVDLAHLVDGKTGGNPFFLKEFLRSLHETGLLQYDTSSGRWEWDFEKIRKQNITDNVATLMASRIQKLPLFVRELLTHAACLGTQFGTRKLARILDADPIRVVDAMGIAVIEGLIIPVEDSSRFTDTRFPDDPNVIEYNYRFSHDKIQAAALSILEDSDRLIVHEKIGKILLSLTPADQIEGAIFDIVNQLNLAIGNISLDDDRFRLAKMNLGAGLKAKLSSAYELALDYFRVGLKLIGEHGWNTDYDLTLDLHVEAVESAYLISRFDEMQSLSSKVLDKGRSLLDKVKVFQVRIQACIAQNNRVEAVKTALPVLAMLDMTFPERPTKIRVIADLFQIRFLLSMSGPNILSKLPEMTDPNKLAAIRIMVTVLPAAYTVTPNLFPVLIFRMIRLTLKYGVAQQSAIAFSAYGLIMCSGINDVHSGYLYSEMALAHVKRFDIKEAFTRVNFIFNSFVRIRREPLRSGLQPLRDGYHSGMEVGDLEYAALSGAFYCTQGYAAGKELQELERELGIFDKAIANLNQQTTHYLAQLYHQAILNLIGDSEDSLKLVGQAFDEDLVLPSMFRLNERAIILATHIHKLILAYLFGCYEEALRNAEVVERYLDGAQGTVLVPLAAFYGSLARLALLDHSTSDMKKKFSSIISRNQSILKKWSNDAPMNYLNKYHLVEAELSRANGKMYKALDHYEMAVNLAKSNELLHEEALALERTAFFYESVGKMINARAYLVEARYCYLRWGAMEKVRRMEKDHSNLLDMNYMTKQVFGRSEGDSDRRDGKSLDVVAVVKASQALSGEIVLKELLTRLMSLVIEIAGAEKGFLIIPENDLLLVCAKADTFSSAEFLDKPFSMDEIQGVSNSIINYVARVKEPIIIHDARGESIFSQDSYVREHDPRSICCIPIMRSGRLSALLYLENNQTIGAFTEQRVEMLKVMSAQAAISIENAILYKTVDESATRYRSLIENAQEIILIIQQGKIKFFNPKCIELSGYSAEELTEFPIADFVHPDDVQMFFERDMEAISEGTLPRLTTFRIMRKQGGHIWVQVNSVVVSWEDMPATLNFMTDVTEIRAAADVNMRSERLKAVGELAAGIAHNFNNLLQVIMSGVDLALLNLESGNPAKIRNSLELIRESSKFGSETVKRLQSFAQIRANDKVIDKKVFDLSKLVKHASEISSPWWKTNLEKDGIHVEMRLDLEHGCEVLGKESELFEVLINLIKNSAEAMPLGGIISIRTFRDQDAVYLKVSDTGVGIGSENLKRLFEPFFSTKGVGGTGLGLAVSHGIINGHGGTISVDSTANVGTTFSITLPLAHSGQIPTDKLKSAPIDLSLRILIIDDSEPALMLMNDLLTANNQTVFCAESGIKGLEIYEKIPIDLIICDLGMPEISGWEVGRIVRDCCKQKVCPKTPFILLTGWGGQSFEAVRISESGVDAILEKPIDISKLFEMIRKIMSS